MEQEAFLSDGTMEAVYSVVSPEVLEQIFNADPQFQPHMLEQVGADDFENLTMQYIHSGNFPLPDSTENIGFGGTPDVPSPTCLLPSFEDYLGPLEFEVELNDIGSSRTNGEYSEKLKKIFVTMGSNIPIDFKWKQYDGNLYVRALPIFLEEDSRAEPVRRCPSHYSENEKSNAGFVHVHHVIRCDNKKTIYDKNEESGRLSVLIPLDPPQPGSKATTIIFNFMCKNSCVLGMNRRATGIIFTLECENGTVVGRRAMKLRICSCPKRDRKKEESNFQVKIETTEPDVPVGKIVVSKIKPPKRLKMNVDSNDMVTLPIRVPRMYKRSILQVIRQYISMPAAYRELTEAEKAAIDSCIALE